MNAANFIHLTELRNEKVFPVSRTKQNDFSLSPGIAMRTSLKSMHKHFFSIS